MKKMMSLILALTMALSLHGPAFHDPEFLNTYRSGLYGYTYLE